MEPELRPEFVAKMKRIAKQKSIRVDDFAARYRLGKNMVMLSAVLHREEDVYVAECPEVGSVSQGKTVEEAIANLKEATELYLEEFPLKEKIAFN